MKPQCETVADCLEQLARVMREFGFTEIKEAVRSEFILHQGTIWAYDNEPTFSHAPDWSFAIAKLEDKPVFLDTGVLFHKETGLASSAKFIYDNKPYMSFDSFSWTPPKQTVSLKVGDNEPVDVEKASKVLLTNPRLWHVEFGFETREAAEQFRKAMKPLVKE